MYTSQMVYDYSCFKIRSRHCPLKVAHKKNQMCRFVDYNFGHLSTEIWYWFILCPWLHWKSNRDWTAFCEIFSSSMFIDLRSFKQAYRYGKNEFKNYFTIFSIFAYHPGNFLPSPKCKFTQTCCSWQSVTFQKGKEIYDIIVRYVYNDLEK